MSCQVFYVCMCVSVYCNVLAIVVVIVQCLMEYSSLPPKRKSFVFLFVLVIAVVSFQMTLHYILVFQDVTTTVLARSFLKGFL